MKIGDRFTLKDGRVVEAILDAGYLLGLKHKLNCKGCCLDEMDRVFCSKGEYVINDVCLLLDCIFKFVEEPTDD